MTGSRIQNPGLTSPTPLTVLTAETFLKTTPSAVDDILARTAGVPKRLGSEPAAAQYRQRGIGAKLRRPARSRCAAHAAAGERPALGPDQRPGHDQHQCHPDRPDRAHGSRHRRRVGCLRLGRRGRRHQHRAEGAHARAPRLRVGGQSQHSDNKEVGLGLSGGFTALDDRMHVVLGANYNDNKGIGNIYSRDWSSVEPGNSGNPISFGATRAAGTAAVRLGEWRGIRHPDARRCHHRRDDHRRCGVHALNLLSFRPDGSTATLVRGPVFGNLMINSSSNPIATPLAQWQLKMPLKQYNALGRVSFDITPTTQAYRAARLCVEQCVRRVAVPPDADGHHPGVEPVPACGDSGRRCRRSDWRRSTWAASTPSGSAPPATTR